MLRYAAILVAPGPYQRAKYPLPEKFNGDPTKIYIFLISIKGYHLKYKIFDPIKQVYYTISMF